MTKLDAFTQAYIECALWSSTDDKGEPLDREHSPDDIDPATLQGMISDCQDFQESNRELLERAYALYTHSPEWSHESQAGHDFWLTRNGHGAGFWDRGLGAVGQELTQAAKIYGSVYLSAYEGKVYA